MEAVEKYRGKTEGRGGPQQMCFWKIAREQLWASGERQTTRNIVHSPLRIDGDPEVYVC